MRKRVLIRKVILNKRNNQISITLPRKPLKLFKNNPVPKKIKLKIEGAIW